MPVPAIATLRKLADRCGIDTAGMGTTAIIEALSARLRLAEHLGDRLAVALGGTGTIVPRSTSGTGLVAMADAARNFTAMGSPVGVHQGFSRVRFKVQADTTPLPTHARVQIRENNASGALLADAWCEIHGANTSTPTWVVCDLGTTVENAAGVPLWFMYWTNGRIQHNQISPQLYPYPAYPKARFSADLTAILTAVASEASSQRNEYVEFIPDSPVSTIHETGVWKSTQRFPVYHFQGWGGPIGIPPSKFNMVELDLFCSNVAYPPTYVHFIIREGNHLGTKLFDHTYTLGVAAHTADDTNQNNRYVVDLGVTFDPQGRQLWFEYMTDGWIGVRETVDITYPEPAYPPVLYTVDPLVEPATWLTVAPTNLGLWLKLSYRDPVKAWWDTAADLQAAITALGGGGGGGTPTPFAPTLNHTLPPKMYALPNFEWNLYWSALWRCSIPEDQIDTNADVTATAVLNHNPTQQNARVYWVPDTTHVGDHALSVVGRWNEQTLRTATSTIKVASPTAGTGQNRKVLIIGDSVTAGGSYPTQLLARFTDPSEPMEITLVGKLGTPPVVHEGISGWKYQFAYDSDGVKYAGIPASSFVFGAGGRFDFPQYMSANGFSMGAGDWVIFNLGINDCFGWLTDTSFYSDAGGWTDMQTWINYMIASIRAYSVSVKIGLVQPIQASAHQDAFGMNYGTNQTQRRNHRNRCLFCEGVRDVYGYSEAQLIYVIPLHGLDNYWNMAWANQNANARNSTQVSRMSNGVHPEPSGHHQIADMLYAFLKGQE